jgi:hypothetical protein
MSRFYVNKFLYHADRDPELLASYKADPRGTVERWEREIGPWMDKNVHAERISWHSFTDDEREALVSQSYVALFALGAHYFPMLQVFMGMFDADYEARSGPLSFQREMAENMRHWLGKEYPSVAL